MMHGELIPPPPHVWGLYNIQHPLTAVVSDYEAVVSSDCFPVSTMSNFTLSTKLRVNFEVDAHADPNTAA